MSAITSQPAAPPVPVSNGIRWLTRAITVLAVVVGPLLFILPDRTDTLFAWTINPPITAAFLGGTYCTALAIDLLAARERIWARARVVYPSLLLFVVLTLVATLLHLDKFHFNSPGMVARSTAWAWLATYILVPVATLMLLISQMRSAGADSRRGSGAVLPPWLRGLLAMQALAMLVMGVPLFVAPDVVAPAWPWSLTPLTAQAIGAWLVGFGVATAHSVLENAWERTYIVCAASVVFGIFELAVLVRFASSMVLTSPASWLYVLFFVSITFTGLYGVYAGRRFYRRVSPFQPNA
jgi:hypothetical protein